MPKKHNADLNAAKINHLMRAFDQISIDAFARELAAYPNRTSDGKNLRAVKAALKRFMNGESGKLSEYDGPICRYANDNGYFLPAGWSDANCSGEQMVDNMHRIDNFPFSPFQARADYHHLCDVLFKDSAVRQGVFKIFRPSFDIDRAVISEVLYVWSGRQRDNDYLAFDYYFTSIQAPGDETTTTRSDNVTSVVIAPQKIHRGSGTIHRFPQGTLWMGRSNGTEDERLIARPRVMFLGPKNPAEPGRHALFGLSLSQSKAFGYHPKSVRCVVERQDELDFYHSDADRAADISKHTTLSFVETANDIASLKNCIHAEVKSDQSTYWKSLRMLPGDGESVMEAMCSELNRAVSRSQ